MAENPHRLAVLIDADNASAKIVDELLAEIAKLGIASVKRLYGDFTSTNLKEWNACIVKHAIQPMQQASLTKGKNASDIALVIDAMDLLHSKRVDGFCLVSSDSDFARLAVRMREEGATVYGFGRRKTPRAFVVACDKFIYTEILRPPENHAASGSHAGERGSPQRAETKPNAQPAFDLKKLPMDTLRHAVESSTDESGWAHLGRVGQVIGNQLSDFDSRNFGFRSTAALFEAIDEFEVRRQGEAGGPQTVFVRIK